MLQIDDCQYLHTNGTIQPYLITQREIEILSPQNITLITLQLSPNLTIPYTTTFEVHSFPPWLSWLQNWEGFLFVLLIFVSLEYVKLFLSPLQDHLPSLTSPLMVFPPLPQKQLFLMIEALESKDLHESVKKDVNHHLPFLKDWSPRLTHQHQRPILNPLISPQHCHIELSKETTPLHRLLRLHSQSSSFANSSLFAESQESKLTHPSLVSYVRPVWTKRGPMHWDRVYTGS